MTRPTLTPEQAAEAAGISLDELRRWADEGMPQLKGGGRIDAGMLVHWAAWRDLRPSAAKLDLNPVEAVALAHLMICPRSVASRKDRQAFAGRVARLLRPWCDEPEAYIAAGAALVLWRLLERGDPSSTCAAGHADGPAP